MNIYEKLLNVQTELKAPKGQFNAFGKYKYRSCEDLLEELKEDAKRRTGNEYSINKSAVKRVRLQINSWLKECEE